MNSSVGAVVNRSSTDSPMMRSRWRWPATTLVAVLFLSSAYGASQLPLFGAGAILHPARRHVAAALPASCENAIFAGAGIVLRGWRCRASGVRRAAIVYLHGVADNRSSGAGIIERFSKRGFEVIAYDSR